MRAAFMLTALFLAGCTRTHHYESKACKTGYEKRIPGGLLKIAVAFGYKDSRPDRWVGDRAERLAFEAELADLGFKSVRESVEWLDPHVAYLPYSKWVLKRWPRGEPLAEPTSVELVVWDSTLGPDDEVNRKDPFLRDHERALVATWESALRNASWLLYNGHSRDGGGPDFSPPRLTGDKHVDYTWYARSQQQLADLLSGLATHRSREHLRFLGIYSCASTQHFSSKIAELRPELRVVSSRSLLYWSDALSAMVRDLRGMLELRCDDAGATPAKS